MPKMKATWNGHVIAESDDTVVVEGNHYFPQSGVRRDHLAPSPKTTVCGWKGTASYFHVEAGGDTNEDAAWSYLDPKPEAAEIADRIAFWKGVTVEEA